jgi:hypothetical protein
MGIASYNRGSRAISNQIDHEIANKRVIATYPVKAAAKEVKVDPLPEGRLRSGFLPEEYLAGTAVFLEYSKGWYRVCTRWQELKRRKRLEDAIKIFENVQLYGSAALI